MPQVSSTVLTIGAALSGVLALGYCVYFDATRRASPNYKKNVKERRRQKRLEKMPKAPDLRDEEAVQSYFLSQVALGEELLAAGEVDEAVEHLGAAIAVCGHPQQLLGILQQSLPPNIFHLLLQRLPTIGQAVHARQLATYGAAAATMDPSSGQGPFGGMSMRRESTTTTTITAIEDDLE